MGCMIPSDLGVCWTFESAAYLQKPHGIVPVPIRKGLLPLETFGPTRSRVILADMPSIVFGLFGNVFFAWVVCGRP